MFLRTVLVVGLAALFAAAAGCGSSVTEFPSNRVFALRLERQVDAPQSAALEDAALVLEALFGTPDDPHVPRVIADDPELAGLLDPERLQRAAGAVASDRAGVDFGLYRKHCVQCHGLAGDGAGATASFQKPYPRDYRLGVFKWKSTPRGMRPTRGDLRRVLEQGVPGTAMPRFPVPAYREEDLEALVDYVIYLSIRGEVERRLLREAAIELGYGDSRPTAADRLIAPALRDSDPPAYREQLDWVRGQVLVVARSWAEAESHVARIPPPPQPLPRTAADLDDPEIAASVARGRELFHGPVANCVSCHGRAGAGDNPPQDYDDWTREWTISAGIDPQDRDQLEPFLEAGALRPRIAEPRDLQRGVFRGGEEAEAVYRRILHGIDGTPMPGASVVDVPGPTGVTREQIWDLVNYVLALGMADDPASL